MTTEALYPAMPAHCSGEVIAGIPVAKRCSRCREVKARDAEFYRNASKSDGREYCCKSCERQRNRRYREVNAGAERQRKRRYREVNAGAVRERMQRYHGDNAARSDEQVVADRARLRPEAMKQCRKCSRHLAFDEFSEHRARADGLLDRCRMCDHAGLVAIAIDTWEDLDLWACTYCGLPFEHTDHVLPSSRGGPDEAWNLVPACADCNLSKSARTPCEWFADLAEEEEEAA